MDKRFQNLHSPKGKTLETIQEQRRRKLRTIYHTERPDLFLIEFYPIGRRKFHFELDPLLADIRAGRLPGCKVVCSVRDILVEKEKIERHEAFAVNILNRYFDGLVVHADPTIVRLEETFGLMTEIRIPVFYSGFVAEQRDGLHDPSAWRQTKGLDRHQHMVLASAGGGAVGFDLLKATAQAVSLLQPRIAVTLQAFTGPYMPAQQVNALARLANPTIRFDRFSNDFIAWMRSADVSVSMAGYNTCMDILATGTTALVYPYGMNREQGMRARRLADRGALEILAPPDLEPTRLAQRLEKAFARSPSATTINLDGAKQTAGWLEALAGSKGFQR
jgi:predicted glycosyltransferase